MLAAGADTPAKKALASALARFARVEAAWAIAAGVLAREGNDSKSGLAIFLEKKSIFILFISVFISDLFFMKLLKCTDFRQFVFI